MKSMLTLATIAAVILASSTTMVMAQGKGGGLNRAMGAQARAGGASAANSKSSNAMARASGNLARSGKAASGLPRMGGNPNVASDPAAVPAEGEQSLTTQDRILSQRMQQAEHLRGVSQRNGNERLQGTADRMEASAIRNFERQTGTVVEPPMTVGEAPATAPAVETATQPRKTNNGFWFRSR